MKKLHYILLLLLFAACKKNDKYPEIEIYGHAGNGIDISVAPYQENSKEAIEYGLSYSELAGIEVDVQWSKDGTAWLYHDFDLEAQTDHSGVIRDLTDEELSDVRYQGIQKEKLIRLNDIIPLLSNRTIILDFKIPAPDDSLTQAELAESLENLFVASVSSNIKLKAIVHSLDFYSILNTNNCEIYLNANSINDYLNFNSWQSTAGVCMNNNEISKDEISQLHALGKKVILYNAKAPKTIRKLLKKLPDCFLADDIRATLIEKIR